MPEVRNRDIVEARLNRLGFKLMKGKEEALSPIVYYFLMDASYQAYCKGMMTADASEKTAQAKGRIKDAYAYFVKDFNIAFNKAQQAYLEDKMDDFEAFIEHDIYIARIAFEESVNTLPLEQQEEMASCWLANLLAKDAQDMYGECYATARRRPMVDRTIDAVIANTKNFAKMKYGALEDYINEKKFKRIQLAVSVIAKKVVEWIHQDYLAEIAKDNGQS